MRVDKFIMKKPDSKNNFSNTLAVFPRRHMAVASILVILLAITSAFLPSPKAEAKRTQLPLELAIQAAEPQEEHITEIRQEENVEKEMPWLTIPVKRGDSLSAIFQRANLSSQQLYQLLQSTPEAKSLKKIYPGQELAFQIDSNNDLLTLRYTKSRLESTIFSKSADNSYAVSEQIKTPEIRTTFKRARIDNSLFLAGQEVGLPHSLIMEMANIFGGVIDFVYDPRKGDEFSVLYEEKYLDGVKISNGAVLAAQYINVGEAHTAFRYKYDNGDVGYFSPEGISMQKAFLRAPLDFTRISSGFNLRRKHPIHKSIRAHRGVDYAAPTGTPIFSAGDGRVVGAGYSKANGNYVFIQHGQQYTTKYLHLHKRYVKKGQRVTQRQIIGTVGSTGYATGPHLHYEFLVNGVHRNPRTILKKLPKAKSIEVDERERFAQHIHGLQLQLAGYTRATQLALLDNNKSMQ